MKTGVNSSLFPICCKGESDYSWGKNQLCPRGNDSHISPHYITAVCLPLCEEQWGGDSFDHGENVVFEKQIILSDKTWSLENITHLTLGHSGFVEMKNGTMQSLESISMANISIGCYQLSKICDFHRMNNKKQCNIQILTWSSNTICVTFWCLRPRLHGHVFEENTTLSLRFACPSTQERHSPKT